MLLSILELTVIFFLKILIVCFLYARRGPWDTS